VTAPAPDPAQADSAAVTTSGDLRKRVASSVVMAVLAVAAVAIGGWTFVVFWTAAAIIISWEWTSIVTGDAKLPLTAAGAALLAAAAAAGSGHPLLALGALAAGALGVAALVRERRTWSGAGVLYAGVLVVAPTLREGAHGAAAVYFLFAVVWVTDILGYFVGRAVGGPRLALRISPKKTWAGAIGGALGAVAAGVVFATLAGYSVIGSGAIAFVLSLVSQGGDLLESAIKRHFGVKDASHVIPGHGGLMDRLDGFIAAAAVAVLIGILRAGSGEAAQGLLLW
jgi:phosphatidate cytidylyltransferase